MDASDPDLLQQFAAKRCEDAFRQLVNRHVGMVFSVADRVTGDAQLAEEIAQTTFAMLARKAGTLGNQEALAGWLYHTARHLALRAIRAEQRRRQREEIAAAMNINEPGPNVVAEHLESAMDQLKPEDRDALVLRFLEDRNLRDVGLELGLSEDAARMRVNRALEKLRGIFGKLGIAGSAAWLVATLPASTSAAVPVGLGASLATAVLSGTAIAATTAAIAAQTTSSTMNLLNLKLAAAVVAAATVAGSSTYLVKEHQADRLRADYQSLKESQAKLASDQQQATATIQLRDDHSDQLKKEVSELPRLRGELDKLNRELATMNAIAAENKRLKVELEDTKNQMNLKLATEDRQKADAEFLARKIDVINDLKCWALALRIDANKHQAVYSRPLSSRELDELIAPQQTGNRFSDKFDQQQYEQTYFGSYEGIDGNTVLIRQRTTMVGPDGKRLKIYALVDGSVQQVSEEWVGPFDQFESRWSQNHEPLVLPPRQ